MHSKKDKKKGAQGFDFGQGLGKNFFDPKKMPKMDLKKIFIGGVAFLLLLQFLQASFEEVPISYTVFFHAFWI